MEHQKASEESITYIILLSALQVILNCSLELKDTIYDQGKAKEKLREAINILTRQNSKNRDHIWAANEIHAANMMYGIQKIGEAVAQDNGMLLHVVTTLSRKGFDLSRCKIVELTDEEIEEYKKSSS